MKLSMSTIRASGDVTNTGDPSSTNRTVKFVPDCPGPFKSIIGGSLTESKVRVKMTASLKSTPSKMINSIRRGEVLGKPGSASKCS